MAKVTQAAKVGVFVLASAGMIFVVYRTVSRTVGTNPIERYVRDVNRGLPVVLVDGARKFVWGLGLAYETDLAGAVQAVHHTDGLGTTRALTDASGATVVAYQLDEYGITVETSGSSGQPFRYTGEQWDQEANVLYLRSRYYRPDLGRFIGRDRTAGVSARPTTLNRYVYVGDNPVSAIDPSGLAPWDNPFCTDPTSQLICGLLGVHPGPGGTLMGGAGGAKNFNPFGGGENDAASAAWEVDAADELAQDSSRYVYRGLAEGENAAAGLTARDPSANIDIASHVAGARQSQWISTTKSLEIAQQRYGQHGVVRIDLSKVNTRVVDISEGIPGMPSNYMLSRWARNAQEVLIEGAIPASAIEVISP